MSKEKSIQERAEFIMDNYPQTRDHDIALYAKFMNIYYWVELSMTQVEKMMNAPSYASIIRERSRLQNNLKTCMASPDVQKRRHQSEKQYRDRYGPMYKQDFKPSF